MSVCIWCGDALGDADDELCERCEWQAGLPDANPPPEPAPPADEPETEG